MYAFFVLIIFTKTYSVHKKQKQPHSNNQSLKNTQATLNIINQIKTSDRTVPWFARPHF